MEIKKLAGSKIEIETEMPAEKFDRFFQLAIKNIQKNLELPGFRKGMAPEKMIREKVGISHILEEAAELVLKEIWPKIIKENNLEPIGQPEISVTKLAEKNPLGLKITITVMPEIALPVYKKIAEEILKEKIEISVTDEEIKKTIELIKKTMPDAVIDETIIKQNIATEKEIKSKEDRRIKIMDSIYEKSNIEIPEILINAELEKMLFEFKNNLAEMGLDLKMYLEHIKSHPPKDNLSKIPENEDDLKKIWVADAKKRVAFGLILRKISKNEGLTPTKDILNNEAEKALKQLPEEDRKKISRDRMEDYLFGKLQNEMVFAFLEK